METLLATLEMPRWKDAVLGGLFMLALRGLPYSLVLLSRSGAKIWQRAGLMLAYTCWVLLSDLRSIHSLLWWCVGLGYYAAASLAIHALAAGVTRVRGMDRLIVFSLLLCVFLAAPAFVLPDLPYLVFLFLGWELTLKSYSYVVESGATQVGARDCLFFFLIDPTVVFTQRARKVPETDSNRPAGMTRVGCGLLSLLTVYAFESIAFSLAGRGMASASGVWVLPAMLLLGLTKLLVTYAKHSGVASIQIGCMRQLGYRVGERYAYPLAARTPMEFWSRWNIYVGEWVKRYVYYPIALTLARRTRGRAQTLARGSALVLAFTCIGLMHDLYGSVAQSTLTFNKTMFFVANGGLILGWVGVAKARAFMSEHTRHGMGRIATSQSAFALAFLCLIGAWN
ncbi:MAG TPA: MBOAT family O-acyltransferase [Polyangiales bacterium]|nr:MBOAT family O-acyltransferase [Polyangiales bacterium]